MLQIFFIFVGFFDNTCMMGKLFLALSTKFRRSGNKKKKKERNFKILLTVSSHGENPSLKYNKTIFPSKFQLSFKNETFSFIFF